MLHVVDYEVHHKKLQQSEQSSEQPEDWGKFKIPRPQAMTLWVKQKHHRQTTIDWFGWFVQRTIHSCSIVNIILVWRFRPFDTPFNSSYNLRIQFQMSFMTFHWIESSHPSIQQSDNHSAWRRTMQVKLVLHRSWRHCLPCQVMRLAKTKLKLMSFLRSSRNQYVQYTWIQQI